MAFEFLVIGWCAALLLAIVGGAVWLVVHVIKLLAGRRARWRFARRPVYVWPRARALRTCTRRPVRERQSRCAQEIDKEPEAQ